MRFLYLNIFLLFATIGIAQPITICSQNISNITLNSVRLNASVNPNGLNTICCFEWGATTSYGNQFCVNIGGTTCQPFFTDLTGLTPGVTYHWRLKISNSLGTSNGPDMTFTLGSAPTICSQSVTPITPTSVRINASVNPNGSNTNVYLEYGLTTSYGNQSPPVNIGSGTSCIGNLLWEISGLTPGLVYHFRIKASNAFGITNGSDMPILLIDPPPTICFPLPNASNITPIGARLNASVNPNGLSTNCYFEWGTTSGYGNQTPTINIGSGSTCVSVFADISGLSRGTTYHFRIKASNGFGITNGNDTPFITSVTFVEELDNTKPEVWALNQNYPNPFNPSTMIVFSLPKSSAIALKVFDQLGREVTTLVNERLNAGTFRTVWDASNIPSGTYFYRLQAGNFIATKRMLLLK